MHIHLFMHSLSTFLLSTYCVPDMALRSWKLDSKQAKVSSLVEIIFQWDSQTRQVNNYVIQFQVAKNAIKINNAGKGDGEWQ